MYVDSQCGQAAKVTDRGSSWKNRLSRNKGFWRKQNPASNGPVAQRIRHLTTDQGIPGSNPGGVVEKGIHFCLQPPLKLHLFTVTFHIPTRMMYNAQTEKVPDYPTWYLKVTLQIFIMVQSSIFFTIQSNVFTHTDAGGKVICAVLSRSVVC